MGCGASGTFMHYLWEYKLAEAKKKLFSVVYWRFAYIHPVTQQLYSKRHTQQKCTFGHNKCRRIVIAPGQIVFSRDGCNNLSCLICFRVMEPRDSSLGEVGSVCSPFEPRQACDSLYQIKCCGSDAVWLLKLSQWRVAEYTTPKYAPCTLGFSWAEGNWEKPDSIKALCFSLLA